MSKLYSYLKKNKLFERAISPILILIVLIIWYFVIRMSEETFIIWVDTLGLFLITLGAIFAIRPIIRTLLNPRLKKEESKLKRDINAGLMAFHYIMTGFTMQFIAKFYLLIPRLILPSGSWSWPVISLALMIITYVLVIKMLKNFKIF
ncbi:Uncharacterised protein [uncultured archaeon]|nr:Uncharacterised protein [uncultured archaeon]